MDDVTRRFLENAQNRSKKLGLANGDLKVPLKDNNVKQTVAASPKRRQSTERKASSVTSPSVKNRAVALRTINNSLGETKNALNIDASKENVDLALEINITTGPNVQVEVEEQELDGDGKVLNTIQKQRKQITSIEEVERVVENVTTPSSCIRDSSRNQLHRLGALYSNPQDLSSPVHRTETAFTIEQDHETRSGTKLKKSKKLAELANSYNEWEDDSISRNRAHKTNANDVAAAATSKSNDAKSFGGIKSTAKSPRKQDETRGATFLNRIDSIENKESDHNKNSNTKKLDWDKCIMSSLEKQGFKRRDTTNKRLEFDFNDETDSKRDNRHVLKPPSGAYGKANKGAVPKQIEAKQPSTKKVEVTKGLVSGRAALFETSASRATNSATANTSNNCIQKNEKDPAEMSLKERMALFERNKSGAMIPKSSISLPASVKQIMADKKPSENIKQVITTPQQPIISSIVTSVAPQSSASATKINNFNKATKAESAASGSGIRQTVAALLAAPATIAEARIANESRKNIEHEMNVVLNRFNQKHIEEPATPPPAPPMPDNLFKSNSSGRKKRLSDEHLVSEDVRRSIESVKRIKVNPPRNGHAYPALSDIESSGAERMTPENYTPEPAYTDDDNEQPIMDRYMYSSQDEGDEEGDSYMDSEEDMSIESDRRDNGRHVHYADSSITTSEGSGFDKYLDEAIDNVEDDLDERNYRAAENGTLASNSFSYERKPLNRQHDTIFEGEATTSKTSSRFQSPIKSRLTVNPSDDNNSVTLTHTVSFYRRQQVLNSPSVHKVVHRSHPTYEHGTIDESTDFYDDDEKITPETKYLRSQEDLAEQKIKTLMKNVMIQNQQIAQSSNALNTCASTLEFSGSAESVVAEWKLLVATHSRKALLEEVERLKAQRFLRAPDAPKECGRLTIKDIVLPLRDDYVKKVSEEKIVGHHLVCLLKYNEHVLATKTIPTLPGLRAVKFPGELHLDNVYADFKITLEIYGMIAQKECIPHDAKYHIHKGKKGVIKTPKGKKAGSCLIMPPIQSPAGPNAVRAPAFAYYGFIIFSLREVQRNTWTLQKSPPEITPLVGTVQMKINCALTVNIDYKGFLTMFEDVSGFGAWHRRWCRLHGNILSYWKYPDDERSKPPIGSLDLSVCEQQKISTAPREMCARLNTLMIELKRRRREDDEDSMLLRTEGEYSYVRQLLSADDKKERDEWCEYFNKTLALMRAWGNSNR
ncbi:anillin isoform X2 [Contarinia nasturtii]|uniref:anillin isoform X2 n=1 Tax=Contarinia nasturtii TaxID=265458 RepID=UPI0012D3EFDD|nr:anillin isoform X2 [Contarinia nasturtii]